MTFLQLVTRLAQHVGTHQIPVNPQADRRRGLIDSSALHYVLMSRIVAAIHAANHCRALGDPVQRDATFEALGPIRMELLQTSGTDMETARLLEELSVALAEVFEDEPPDTPPAGGRRKTGNPPLVRLDPRRRRKK